MIRSRCRLELLRRAKRLKEKQAQKETRQETEKIFVPTGQEGEGLYSKKQNPRYDLGEEEESRNVGGKEMQVNAARRCDEGYPDDKDNQRRDVGEDDFWCGEAGRGAWLKKEMGKDETNKDSMSTLIREKQKAGNPTRVKGNGRKRRKPPGNAQQQQPIRL